MQSIKSLKIAIALIATLFGITVTSLVHATTINVMIGDDDGFDGTQGATSSAGDPYNVGASANLGSIAPGSYSNDAGLDVNPSSPWSPYTFTFDFAYDASTLNRIDTAVVEIQHGSVGLRSTGSPGFGFATVSASSGDATLALGNFVTVATSPAGSALEQSVKISSFNVVDLISAHTIDTLTLVVDGTGISPNPFDLFAIDFAELTITGIAVPEPSALVLFCLGLAVLVWFQVLASQRRLGHRIS